MTKRQRLWLLTGVAVFVTGFVLLAVFSPRDTGDFDYAVYRVEGGWGYDISHDGKTIIHQPFEPVVEGHRPFADRASARAAAVRTIERFAGGGPPASPPIGEF